MWAVAAAAARASAARSAAAWRTIGATTAGWTPNALAIAFGDAPAACRARTSRSRSGAVTWPIAPARGQHALQRDESCPAAPFELPSAPAGARFVAADPRGRRARTGMGLPHASHDVGKLLERDSFTLE